MQHCTWCCWIDSPSPGWSPWSPWGRSPTRTGFYQTSEPICSLRTNKVIFHVELTASWGLTQRRKCSWGRARDPTRRTWDERTKFSHSDSCGRAWWYDWWHRLASSKERNTEVMTYDCRESGVWQGISWTFLLSTEHLTFMVAVEYLCAPSITEVTLQRTSLTCSSSKLHCNFVKIRPEALKGLRYWRT